MRIREFSSMEKPHKKLLTYGVQRLTTDELLAIILGSGTKKMNAVMLAHYIRTTVMDYSYNNLIKIHGLGEMKISKILASVEFGKRQQQKIFTTLLSPKDVWNAVVDIRSSKKEYLVAFYLDVQNFVVKKEIVSIGSMNESIAHPREIFEPAITHNAAQIILCHNHPSGVNRPSNEDIILTKRISKAGDILGIALADHVIVTNYHYFSFKEQKLL